MPNSKCLLGHSQLFSNAAFGDSLDCMCSSHSVRDGCIDGGWTQKKSMIRKRLNSVNTNENIQIPKTRKPYTKEPTPKDNKPVTFYKIFGFPWRILKKAHIWLVLWRTDACPVNCFKTDLLWVRYERHWQERLMWSAAWCCCWLLDILVPPVVHTSCEHHCHRALLVCSLLAASPSQTCNNARDCCVDVHTSAHLSCFETKWIICTIATFEYLHAMHHFDHCICVDLPCCQCLGCLTVCLSTCVLTVQ